MKKKKLLIFHQSLAPYRVDFWNKLNELFDLKLYFIYQNHLDQKFDQERLRNLLDFTPEYLNSGLNVGVRAFRWGFIRAIRQFNPDIVFTYEYSQTTISLFLIKKLYFKDFKLFTICDDSLHIAETCSGARKSMRNYLISKLDGIILPNKNVADWYKLQFTVIGKVLVFPIIAKGEIFRNNLTNVLPFTNRLIQQHSLTGCKCVFFVGRLAPEKGVDRLIQSFSMVCQVHKDIKLIVIGEGSEKMSLQQSASKLGIEKDVYFVGRYEGDDLLAWYNIGQIFVLASHYEPFGAVVNEALLSGAFVICSTNAGASSLISPGDNGELFSPYDTVELGKLLDDKLEDIMPVEEMKEIRSSKMLSFFDEYMDKLFINLTN
ncbi:glycosyltransferase [Dyadobacter psychrotolerans]|uniref:Glycosyltransferase n=1 Tax=Dyadobacter psychrotolerans TaxID=2541721 RepID=A0A4R5D4R5_9BACT|nr:glycosyltransferase [Dyadobacter psychrotolerans]TDE08409.1 glycosyltransferase [Dyadobacter psychrotolerans]